MFVIDPTFYDTQELKRVEHEKFLNLLGYVPLLSILSGTFRLLEGFITSAQETIAFCEAYAKAVTAETDDEYAYYAFEANKQWDYYYHSSSNILRGFLELVPIGSMACILYDAMGNRMEYSVEQGGNQSLLDTLSTFKGKVMSLDPLVYDYLMYRIIKVRGERERAKHAENEMKEAS